MLPLLLKIIPLGVASALSPFLLAFTVILLGSKNRPKEKVLALLSGTILVLLLLTFLGLAAGNSEGKNQDTIIDTIINLILGGLCIFFAVKTFLVKRRNNGEERKWQDNEPKNVLLKLFLLGFVINITNFDGELFYLAAIKEIYQTSIGVFWKIIFNIISMLFYLFPILFPFLAYLMWPSGADKIITPVANLMKKYGAAITEVLFLLFGFYFLGRGFGIVH